MLSRRITGAMKINMPNKYAADIDKNRMPNADLVIFSRNVFCSENILLPTVICLPDFESQQHPDKIIQQGLLLLDSLYYPHDPGD